MITDEVKVGRVGLRSSQVRYNGFQRTEYDFSEKGAKGLSISGKLGRV